MNIQTNRGLTKLNIYANNNNNNGRKAFTGPGAENTFKVADLRRLHSNTLKRRPNPSIMLADDNNSTSHETPRDFSFTAAGFDDAPNLTTISYIVATEDYCDCITFPDDFSVIACTNNAIWGSIQLKYSDDTCYDVQSDISTMYSSCTPDDEVTDHGTYTYCEINFDYSLDDTTSGFQSSSEDTPQSSAGSSDLDTTTSSADQLGATVSGERSMSDGNTNDPSSSDSIPNTADDTSPTKPVTEESSASTQRSIFGRIVVLTFVAVLAFQ
ncbi:unnamed protein product [Phytophthora fragariaefolia]|uniref:Unnamed protein product n=1 Tax=Phytophthora fragariaefolia TaxID=1490495 RepID=A0A9W7CSB7_9STRA|nr:unnamed protein product [Phytophthora fragariaefolia]